MIRYHVEGCGHQDHDVLGLTGSNINTVTTGSRTLISDDSPLSSILCATPTHSEQGKQDTCLFDRTCVTASRYDPRATAQGVCYPEILLSDSSDRLCKILDARYVLYFT